MKILAFDQASRKTGAAWFEDTTLLGYELIDYSKMKNGTLRVKDMILTIYQLIEEIKPDVIVYEDVSVQRNAGAALLLAQIEGSLLGYCFEHNIIGMVYKPSEWRRVLGFVQGSKVKSAELKEQARAFVREHYGVDPSEDEADAICIGCAFACSWKERLDQLSDQSKEEVKTE